MAIMTGPGGTARLSPSNMPAIAACQPEMGIIEDRQIHLKS